MSIYRQILRFVILTKNAAGNEYFHLKPQRKMDISTKTPNGNEYFRWWKRLFPLVEMDISTGGNRYFRRTLLKLLIHKGLRAIFCSYNIIIIEIK